jgi:hypothetical protein
MHLVGERQRWKEARVRKRALSISMRSFSPSVVPNSHDWCYTVGLRQIERNGKKFSFYQVTWCTAGDFNKTTIICRICQSANGNPQARQDFTILGKMDYCICTISPRRMF